MRALLSPSLELVGLYLEFTSRAGVNVISLMMRNREILLGWGAASLSLACLSQDLFCMPSLLTGGSNLNLTLSHFTLSFITQAGPLVFSYPHFWLCLEVLMRMEGERVKAWHIGLGKGGRPNSRGSYLRGF